MDHGCGQLASHQFHESNPLKKAQSPLGSAWRPPRVTGGDSGCHCALNHSHRAFLEIRDRRPLRHPCPRSGSSSRGIGFQTDRPKLSVGCLTHGPGLSPLQAPAPRARLAATPQHGLFPCSAPQALPWAWRCSTLAPGPPWTPSTGSLPASRRLPTQAPGAAVLACAPSLRSSSDGLVRHCRPGHAFGPWDRAWHPRPFQMGAWCRGTPQTPGPGRRPIRGGPGPSQDFCDTDHAPGTAV